MYGYMAEMKRSGHGTEDEDADGTHLLTQATSIHQRRDEFYDICIFKMQKQRIKGYI